MKIAEAWKPGTAKNDNGAIVALFMAERRIRIEVGYGLEGAVPDAVASRIIRDRMVPAMRAGKPAVAVMQAVDAIARASAGEPLSERATPSSRPELFLSAGAIVMFLLFLAVMALIARAAQRGQVISRKGVRHDFPWWMLTLPRGGGGSSHRGGWGGGGGFGEGGGFSGGGGFGGGGASGSW